MADHFYIAQTAQGAGTGVDPANALAVTWFNNPSNWGAGTTKLSPGDFAHVVGSITTRMDFQGSGSDGLPITLFFEAGSKLTQTAGTLCNTGGNDYLIFDGNGVGIIENTDNGTLLGNQVAVSGIYASGSSHVEIKGLTFQNLYVNDPTQDPVPDFSTQGAVYFNGVGDGISIHDCVFDNICWVLNFQGGAGIGLQVFGNVFTDYDHGIAGLGAMSDVLIYENDFGSTSIWDTPGNIWHHDGIHVFFGAGVMLAGLRIYRNKFHGNWGVNNTAHIFIEGDFTRANEDAVEGFIYNNLHLQEAGNLLNNGFLAATLGNGGVWSNTYLGSGVSDSVAVSLRGSNQNVQNNITSGVRTFINFQVRVDGGNTNIQTLDNNLYAAMSGSGNSPFILLGAGYANLAAWQTATGDEANSFLVANALLAPNYVPTSSSDAVGNGANLSANFTDDYRGNIRVAPWDIGAFAYTIAPVAGTGILTSSGFLLRAETGRNLLQDT